MKRMICYVLAVFLAAALWPTGSVDAMRNPVDYISVREDSGEDHPWGGEQNNDNPGLRTSTDPISYDITGFLGLDMFFWKLMAPVWMSDTQAPAKSGYIIIYDQPSAGIDPGDVTTEQPDNSRR